MLPRNENPGNFRVQSLKRVGDGPKTIHPIKQHIGQKSGMNKRMSLKIYTYIHAHIYSRQHRLSIDEI